MRLRTPPAVRCCVVRGCFGEKSITFYELSAARGSPRRSPQEARTGEPATDEPATDELAICETAFNETVIESWLLPVQLLRLVPRSIRSLGRDLTEAFVELPLR